MRQYDPSLSLSVRLVEWLRRQGKTQKEVAALLDVSESFISRVASGHRSLTIDHLARLEDRLKRPLLVLLLESDLANEEIPEKRAILEEALTLLQKSFVLRTELAATGEQSRGDSADLVESAKKKRKRASRLAS